MSLDLLNAIEGIMKVIFALLTMAAFFPTYFICTPFGIAWIINGVKNGKKLKKTFPAPGFVDYSLVPGLRNLRKSSIKGVISSAICCFWIFTNILLIVLSVVIGNSFEMNVLGLPFNMESAIVGVIASLVGIFFMSTTIIALILNAGNIKKAGRLIKMFGV